MKYYPLPDPSGAGEVWGSGAERSHGGPDKIQKPNSRCQPFHPLHKKFFGGPKNREGKTLWQFGLKQCPRKRKPCELEHPQDESTNPGERCAKTPSHTERAMVPTHWSGGSESTRTEARRHESAAPLEPCSLRRRLQESNPSLILADIPGRRRIDWK